MKILDDYFKLQKEIYDYFGYHEDWVVIPLDDATDAYWILDMLGGFVRYAETISDLQDTEAGAYYESGIYKQRFLPKWVYRTKDYTMICVDTHTDGNKFLQIFDNTKEALIKRSLKQSGRNHWTFEKERNQKTKDKISKSLKNYYKNNIHPFSNKKHSEETKNRIRNKLMIPISQYTFEGKFIRNWLGTSIASKELELFSTGINASLKGKRKSCGRFRWKYQENKI